MKLRCTNCNTVHDKDEFTVLNENARLVACPECNIVTYLPDEPEEECYHECPPDNIYVIHRIEADIMDAANSFLVIAADEESARKECRYGDEPWLEARDHTAFDCILIGESNWQHRGQMMVDYWSA